MESVKLRNIYFVECESCGTVDYNRDERNADIAASLHESNCDATKVQKSKIDLEKMELLRIL